MLVKIIKSSSPKRWYADMIGHVIEVEKKYPGAWVLKNGDGVDLEDAVEVKNEELFEE